MTSIKVAIDQRSNLPIINNGGFRQQNGTAFYTLVEYPGTAIELTLLLVNLIGYGPIDVNWVVSDGWNRAKSGRGMLDLVADGRADISLANYWLTDEPALRPVLPTLPTEYEPGNCFMICGDKFLRRPPSSIAFLRLVSKASLAILALSLVVVYFIRTAQSETKKKISRTIIGRIKRSISSNLIGCLWPGPLSPPIGSFLRPRYWLPSWLCLLFALLILIEGVYKSLLLTLFAPTQIFPFTSIQNLAFEMDWGTVRLIFRKKNLVYLEVYQNEVFRPLADSLKWRPPFIFNFADSEIPKNVAVQIFRQNVVMRVTKRKFMKHFMRGKLADLNCICSDLGTSGNFPAGLIVNVKRRELRDKLDLSVLELVQTGIVQKIMRKYGHGSQLISSSELRNRDISRKNVPVSFAVISPAFYLLALSYSVGIFMIAFSRNVSFIQWIM